MEMNTLKETILETKLNFHRSLRLKNESVLSGEFEKASGFREQEKECWENLCQLEREIEDRLNEFKKKPNDLADYIELQSLLFEFHPINFYKSCMFENKEMAVKNYVSTYWELRNQLHREMISFLLEEYQKIRKLMHQFKDEGDEENAKRALYRLKDIGDLIIRYKP